MERWNRFRESGLAQGLLASAALHVVLAVGLLVTVPWPDPEPEPPAIDVTLVAPPEQAETPEPKGDPSSPAEAAGEPEEAVPETPQEAPPPPAGETEDTAKPAPEAAAPLPQEQQTPEPQPAEPETPAPQTAEPETPESPAPEPDPAPPEPQQPDAQQPEAPTEQPPEPQDEAASTGQDAQSSAGEASSLSQLRPVFQFGEEDSGPRLAPDGSSSEAPEQPAPTTDAEPADEAAVDQTNQPDPSLTDPSAAGVAAADGTLADPGITAPTIAMPEINLPDAPLAGTNPDSLPDPADQTQLSGLAAVEPAPATATAPSAATGISPAALAPAKKLFSTAISNDPVAMTAVGNLPRGVRASELCTTELREQLRHAAPPYLPELLPSYQLDSGNVLEVPNAAFRASGKWYSLQFRCTVDDDAMKVAGFAMTVGAPIPRSEWKARGFPDF